jgi:hypothetical protein
MAEKQYDNTNRGAIFVNDRKQRENQPDRTGTLNVEGTEYFISGWLKKDRNGNSFMSLSVTKKEQQPEQQRPVDDIDPNEEVPF